MKVPRFPVLISVEPHLGHFMAQDGYCPQTCWFPSKST
jgi:hypothetical protein